MIQLKKLLNEEKRKLSYKGGDTYVGEVTGTGKNAVRNGYGEFKWKSGETYKGHYKDNLFHGYGVFTFNDGSKMKGQWVNDKFTGNGNVYVTAVGVEYHGNFIESKLNGKSLEDLDKMKAPVDIKPKDTTRFVYPGDKVWIYAKNKNKEWLAAKRGTAIWYNLSASTNPKMQQAAKDLDAKAEVDIQLIQR